MYSSHESFQENSIHRQRIISNKFVLFIPKHILWCVVFSTCKVTCKAVVKSGFFLGFVFVASPIFIIIKSNTDNKHGEAKLYGKNDLKGMV